MSDIINLLLKDKEFKYDPDSNSRSVKVVVYTYPNQRASLRDEVQKELSSMKIEWKQERKSFSSKDVTTFKYQDKKYTIIYKPFAKGQFAGAVRTSRLESAQAYFCAAMWDNDKVFTEENFAKYDNKVFVEQRLDDIVKELSEDWINSSINTALKLHEMFGNRSYTFHKGSDWVKNLKNNFTMINKVDKKFGRSDKWNPADLYLVAPSELNRKFNFSNLLELNKFLNDKLLSKEIIPVSLKKTPKVGNAKVSYVNIDSTRTTYRYSGYNLAGFFTSNNVYVNYEGGKIEFRTSPNFSGEIIGKFARHGRIGVDTINQILTKHLKLNIPYQSAFKLRYNRDPMGVADDMYEFYKYLGTNVEPYEKFMEKYKNTSYSWKESKFIGLQLLFAIESGREKADRIVSDIISYAKSESELSAPFIKVE